MREATHDSKLQIARRGRRTIAIAVSRWFALFFTLVFLAAVQVHASGTGGAAPLQPSKPIAANDLQHGVSNGQSDAHPGFGMEPCAAGFHCVLYAPIPATADLLAPNSLPKFAIAHAFGNENSPTRLLRPPQFAIGA